MDRIHNELAFFRIPVARLVEIRRVLDNPRYTSALQAALSIQVRDGQPWDNCNNMRERRRLIDERAKQMDRFKTFVHQIGVAGGAAFVAAALVQLALGTLKPQDSLYVWFSALSTISFGISAACVLDERRVLFDHIAERLKFLTEALEKDLVPPRA